MLRREKAHPGFLLPAHPHPPCVTSKISCFVSGWGNISGPALTPSGVGGILFRSPPFFRFPASRRRRLPSSSLEPPVLSISSHSLRQPGELRYGFSTSPRNSPTCSREEMDRGPLKWVRSVLGVRAPPRSARWRCCPSQSEEPGDSSARCPNTTALFVRICVLLMYVTLFLKTRGPQPERLTGGERGRDARSLARNQH